MQTQRMMASGNYTKENQRKTNQSTSTGNTQAARVKLKIRFLQHHNDCSKECEWKQRNNAHKEQ
jgi:hypothetical protein